MTENTQAQTTEMKGILAWIEKSGNKLPDPVFIFLYCIAAVVVISVVCQPYLACQQPILRR